MTNQSAEQRLDNLCDRLDVVEQKLSALSKPSLATGFVFTAPEGTALIQTSPHGSKRLTYQLVAVKSDAPPPLNP